MYISHPRNNTALAAYCGQNAEVAELVDALASGASGGNPVEVQVLSSVPIIKSNSYKDSHHFFVCWDSLLYPTRQV